MTVTKKTQNFFEHELRDLVLKYVRRHKQKIDVHERFLDTMRNIPWKLRTLRVRNTKPYSGAYRKGRAKSARKD